MEKLLSYTVIGPDGEPMQVIRPATDNAGHVIRDYWLAKNGLSTIDDFTKAKIADVDLISWEDAIALGYDEKVKSNIPTK